jgi:preprotein translocase subunit SecF
MEFFHGIPHLDFMRFRRPFMAGSIVVIIIAVAFFAARGLNLGIDFTGGITAQVKSPQAIDVTAVQGAMRGNGFPHASVQHFGTPTQALIHMRPRNEAGTKGLGPEVMAAVHNVAPKATLSQVNIVGASVGSNLAGKGTIAVVVTLAAILIYLWFRFEWRLALGAIFSTFHDIVFLVGFFSILQIKFDLTVLAAFLAVIGYSMNDTVVVFDRIRENFRKKRRASSYDIVNTAVNETLSRTIMTSVMTLLVVIAMLIFAGPVLHGFALALLVGILIGTYSSIFVASASALMLGVSKEDLMVKKKEELVDDRP